MTQLARRDVQTCVAILSRGSKSFRAASHLLPARMRAPAAVFYAFCRAADDAVDESDDPGRAVEMLTGRLERLYRGEPWDEPVDRALVDVVHAYELPRALFDALIEGFVWDAQARRYESLSDVLAYAARVASAVGAVMTLLMGRRHRGTLARACDLGAAMQLTNICRDVGEDARRGRIYLPEAWLREAGHEPRAFLQKPVPSPAVRAATQRLLDEADGLYRRAWPGIADLPADCRPAMRAAAWIYADIGRVIARKHYDAVTSRAHTTAWRKLWLLARAWLSRGPRDEQGLDAPPLPEVAFLVDAAADAR